MKRILLTGATGFLGSHIAERLLMCGHTVACPVRDVDNLGRLYPLRKQVKLIPVKKLELGIEEFGADTVIHTACAYSRNASTIQDIWEGNLLFPLRVLEKIRKQGRVRWINTDTCLPIYLNEYSLSKKQFCQWGKFYGETAELQFVNLQLEHFYGPNAPRDQFLTWVIEKLKSNKPLDLTTGTQKRDFVYIGDVLDVYEAVLNREIAGTYVNIPVGTGEAPSIREVVEYLKECTHSNSELRFGAIPNRKREVDSACDVRKLQEIGIVPQIHWQDGMKNMI